MWRAAYFTRCCIDGDQRTKGWVKGPFAMHVGSEGTDWILTHRPTGYQITTRRTRRKLELVVAQLRRYNVDWEAMDPAADLHPVTRKMVVKTLLEYQD